MGSSELSTKLNKTFAKHYMLLMLLISKGLKVVFVAYVHNIDTFNAMLKGLKETLIVLIGTHLTHV